MQKKACKIFRKSVLTIIGLMPVYLLLLADLVYAQTTVNGSFDYGGITRTYSFYVPASYVQGQPVPLVLNLHGYSSNGAQQAIYGDFRPIADTAGFIVAHPDGTIDPIYNQRFWNFGIMGSTVDDAGFLEALLDTISAGYSVNSERIYCTGMSNGGFMCYALACQSNRFAAIGSVTGSMSIAMYNTCNPVHPIPVLHIHGTDDAVNPYAGNTTSKGIADVVNFWVGKNGCSTTPSVVQLPDINQADNATAEHYLYSGGMNGHTVEHFKVTGGGHTWPGSIVPLPGNGNTCMDFNASAEIWRFFSQFTLSGSASIADPPVSKVNMWPNPANGYIYIDGGNRKVSGIVITDTRGSIIKTITGENIQKADLSYLKAGSYLIRITGNHVSEMQKLVVLPR